MVPRKQGKIINVASLNSFIGGEIVASYAASKGAVSQLTKALSNEWAKYNIQVNAIAPGSIATDMYVTLLPGGQGRHLRLTFPLFALQKHRPPIRSHSIRCKDCPLPGWTLGRPEGLCWASRVPGEQRQPVHHRRNSCRRWRPYGAVD